MSQHWSFEKRKESNQDIGANNSFSRSTGEIHEVGLLRRELEMKLPYNFYSAMVQLKSLERHLQKYDAIWRRYQEALDTDVKADYVRKTEQDVLKEKKKR